MPIFLYRALDLDATVIQGAMVSDSLRQARDTLRERGLTVTEVVLTPERLRPSLMQIWQGRRSLGEIASFIRELATLLKAGLPLPGALQTLARQHKGCIRTVIEKVFDDISGGAGLAEAMTRQPAFFDMLSVHIVRVGENTGALEASLERLAEYKEKSGQLKSRITTALIYPAIVGVVALAVTLFLMTNVTPNLIATLESAGRELPLITRLVKGASDAIIKGWWAILLCAGGIIAGAVALMANERARSVVDRIILRIPVLGDLIRKENTSRMAVVLAALLRSGLPFIEAIQVTRRTLRNSAFREALDRYESAIAAGRDVATPLSEGEVFPPMVVEMLAVGQQAGEMEEMLEQLACAYDRQVEIAAQRFTAVLEPALIVFLAIGVGAIAFATLLPILEMSHVL